jgi:ribosomal protein S18 acetylase RimI-like enzyme
MMGDVCFMMCIERVVDHSAVKHKQRHGHRHHGETIAPITALRVSHTILYDWGMNSTLVVRAAEMRDLNEIAVFALALVRLHHGLDPARFFSDEGTSEGYATWLREEFDDPHVVLTVAEDGGRIVGYVYGRMEGRNWNVLLDPHAALHDIFVDDTSRKTGIGDAMLEAFVAEVTRRGAVRVVLHAAVGNERAQALFRKHGFRPTMVEMTR